MALAIVSFFRNRLQLSQAPSAEEELEQRTSRIIDLLSDRKIGRTPETGVSQFICHINDLKKEIKNHPELKKPYKNAIVPTDVVEKIVRDAVKSYLAAPETVPKKLKASHRKEIFEQINTFFLTKAIGREIERRSLPAQEPFLQRDVDNQLLDIKKVLGKNEPGNGYFTLVQSVICNNDLVYSNPDYARMGRVPSKLGEKIVEDALKKLAIASFGYEDAPDGRRINGRLLLAGALKGRTQPLMRCAEMYVQAGIELAIKYKIQDVSLNTGR